jgi:hypothetical protein
MRCRSELLGCAIVAMSLSGCAFGDGRPWAVLDPHLDARFAPSSLRIDDDGLFKTADSWLVELDDVSVTFAELSVKQASTAGAALSFDPADPPEGYTVCHNGHCDAVDGRQVPYAVVEAELQGGGADAPATVLDLHAALPLTETATSVEVPCDDDVCQLARGPVVAAELVLEEVHLSGTAFDALPSARVGDAGVPFDVHLTDIPALSAALDAEAERFQPLRFRLDASFGLAETLLDPVHFDREEPFDDETREKIGALVAGQSLFSANIAGVDR